MTKDEQWTEIKSHKLFPTMINKVFLAINAEYKTFLGNNNIEIGIGQQLSLLKKNQRKLMRKFHQNNNSTGNVFHGKIIDTTRKIESLRQILWTVKQAKRFLNRCEFVDKHSPRLAKLDLSLFVSIVDLYLKRTGFEDVWVFCMLKFQGCTHKEEVSDLWFAGKIKSI